MDICRNISVSGGLQYQQQQQPEYQVGSLDDLFSGHPLEEEGDVNMEWLSTFVEECLSSTGHCLLPPTNTNHQQQQKQLMKPPTPKPTQLIGTGNNTPSAAAPPFQLDKLVIIPVKGTRSKRKRSQSHLTTTRARRPSWWSPPPPPPQNKQVLTSADPPLLQQAYWLADSELIFPQKHLITNTTTIDGHEHEHEQAAVRQGRGRRKKKHHNHNHKEEEGEDEEEGSSSNGGVGGGGIRRCSHCLSQRTPQWRAGPLGPKTLCNACGVRYKSGRLLPEYRPAKSPSFVSYMHSNSHKKVLEMRTLSSSPSPSS